MKVSFLPYLLFLFISCTKAIDVPIPRQERKIVIESRITNFQNLPTLDKDENNYVKINKTTYLNGSDIYFIPGANVSVIEENTGTVFPYEQFFYLSYIPVQNFAGKAGNTYTLNIKVGDSIYTATDKMPNLCTIDSMYVTYLEQGYSLLQNAEGYYLHVLFRDNPSEKNYYRYKIGSDNSFTPTINSIDFLDIFDVKFLNSTQNIIIVPYAFTSGDVIYFELQSLSFKAYDYYRGLNLLLTSDGGFFTTPPANPTSNISNGALGFFMATQISTGTLTVP